MGIRGVGSLIVGVVLTTRAVSGEFFTDIRPEMVPPNPNKDRQVLCLPALSEKPPVLDGKINDPIWRKAITVRGMTDLGTGLPDWDSMRAWVCRDSTALYVAIEVSWRMWEYPWPDMKPTDSLAVQLNPRHPGYSVYWLGTGVPGKKWHYVAPGFLPFDDNAWSAGSRETKGKRYAEFAIPYATFPDRSPGPGTVWGFNIIRSRQYNAPQKYAPANFLGTFGGAELSWAYINSSTWSTPEQFNLIFFGSKEELDRKGLPSCVRLYLDRRVYHQTDPYAQGYVEVDPGSRDLGGTSVTLRVTQGDRDIAKSSEIKIGGQRAMSFLFPVGGLPEGDYLLRAGALDLSGSPLGEASWQFSVKRTAVPPAQVQRTIPIVVWSDRRIGTLDFPISTGIPLPEGAVNDLGSLRLRRDDAEVPFQASARALWSPKGSVKWMGLDFVASYRNGAPVGSYKLELGVKPSTRFDTPLRLEESAENIIVTTGPTRFTISKKKFRLFDRAEFDANGDGKFAGDELVLAAGDGDGPVFEDDRGNSYLASDDPESQVVVEEVGPVKAVVHAKGWYTGKRGRMCLYSIRMFFYAGVPGARVTHSWTVTFDTDKVGVRNLRLGHWLPGGIKAYRLGSMNTAHAEPKEGLAVGPNESHYMLQTRWDQSRFVKDPPGTILEWQHRYMARPFRGTADVTTPNGRVIVTMRNFWQLFPKEIELRHDRLFFHIWPRHGVKALEGELDVNNIYKLWYVHQGQVLRFKLPQEYFDTMKTWFENNAGFYVDKPSAALIANAQGLSQTNEFLYWFAKPGGVPAEQISDAFEADPHAIAEPEWTCSSNVFPGLYPRDPARFPRFERGLERFFDACCQIIDEENGYGMFNWFDAHTYYSPGAPGMIHRVWQGQHYGASRNSWLYYVRSGQPKYYWIAKARTRHAMDCDTVGYAERPSRFKDHWPGAVYHCKGFVHWGGDAEVIGHPTSIDHDIWAFYLTGDRRSMDMADLWRETFLEYSLVGEMDREWTQTFGEALELYDATHDPRMLKPIWELAKGTISLDVPLGAWQSYHQFWGPRYYRMSRDPDYVELLKDFMGANPKNKEHAKLKEPLFGCVWYYLATGDSAAWESEKQLQTCLLNTPACKFGGETYDPAMLQLSSRSWGWGRMSYEDVPACFALSAFAAAGLDEEGKPALPQTR